MHLLKLLLTVFALFGLCQPAQAEPSYEKREVKRLAWPKLERFENDREFRRYLRQVRAIDRRRRSQLKKPPIVVATSQDVPPEQCTDPEECPELSDKDGTIIVTGSRIARNNYSSVSPVAVVSSESIADASITNNQKTGVDEGDIVKRIGDYFLVLQDGRIFAVNFQTMAMTDRIDVYRKDEDGDPIGADWYDEMLVQGDQIIVAAYSYEDDASELSVFRLNQTSGRIERRGVFLISGDDYYDIDNYATRVVGDNLVMYTPYEAEDLASRNNRPKIRRWVPSEEFDDDDKRASLPVLDADDIFRPVLGIKEPWVHTISVCPLGNLGKKDLRCTSTGFVAAETAEMFVSPNAVFLFTTAMDYDDSHPWNDCKAGTPRADNKAVVPGVVFRMPHRSDRVDMLPVRGLPYNQFSLDEHAGRFRMLSAWVRTDCDDRNLPAEFSLIDEPIRAFGDAYFPPNDRRFAELPAVTGRGLENRFVGPWLLYGTRDSWHGRPPSQARGGSLQVIPVADPDAAQTITLDHQVTRIEQLGNDAVLTGYRDMEGLRISYLDLDAEPSVAGTTMLDRRYESESRSHAFNATMTPDGSGMMALPTVYSPRGASRYPWRSDTSDLSFLKFGADGSLSGVGEIDGKPEDEINPAIGYECEVSCVDWYGNTRPFFVAGRIFGLMGTDLVEAELIDGKIAEKTRVDLTNFATDAEQ